MVVVVVVIVGVAPTILGDIMENGGIEKHIAGRLFWRLDGAVAAVRTRIRVVVNRDIGD